MSNQDDQNKSWQQIIENAKSQLQALEQTKEDLEKHIADLTRQKSDAEKNIIKLRDSIQDYELKVPCQWNIMYHKLLKFKEEHGHVNVKYLKKKEGESYDAELVSLGRFVGNQRVFYKYYQNGDTKHIKPHRIEALNRIGFVWDLKKKQWEDNVSLLKDFIAENGHSYVNKDASMKKLHNFVVSLRTAWEKHNKGMPSLLTPDRVHQLQDLGFSFERPVEQPEVVEEKEEFPGFPKLPQRPQRPKRKSRAKPDSSRKKSLKMMSSEEYWEYQYSKLKEFYETHGHVQVNSTALSDEAQKLVKHHNLIEWVAYQRTQEEYLRDGKKSWLSLQQKGKLENLGLIWRRPRSEPRKSGGSYRKRKKVEEDSPLNDIIFADDKMSSTEDEDIDNNCYNED